MGVLESAQGLAAAIFGGGDAGEEAEVGAVLEGEHVAEVADAFGAGPVVGHVADVGEDEGVLEGLLLAPAVWGLAWLRKPMKVSCAPASAQP